MSIPKKMRGLVQLDKKEPFNLQLCEIDVPELKHGYVLIRVQRVGICGSDLHAAACNPNFSFVPPLMTFGHEAEGIIVALGEGVENWAPDDRVTFLSIYGCGDCIQCNRGWHQLCSKDKKVQGFHENGAMAEYVLVQAERLVKLEDNIPFGQGALVEPLTILTRGFEQLPANWLQNDFRVFVSGPGPIGLLGAMAARHMGIEDITVIGHEVYDAPHRIPLAQNLGFKTDTDGPNAPFFEKLGEEGDQELRCDVYLECSGANEPLQNAPKLLRKGGKTIIVATYAEPEVSFDATVANRAEQGYYPTHGGTHHDYEVALRMISEGMFTPEILGHFTAEFPLDDIVDAFHQAHEGKVGKPIITISD